ncbi:MAG TPA: hypothetical protein VF148_02090 [Acidimicrobiia bacterium]
MTEAEDRATSSPTDVVERLADALDRDDYVTAASLMADRIEYIIGEQEKSGPEAVIASYRDASQMAHRLFDRVEYGHHVMPTHDPNTFQVSYSDTLTVAGETLKHMAEQHVTVAPAEGVVRIVNIEVPGEREKVDAFMERHGLARDP